MYLAKPSGIMILVVKTAWNIVTKYYSFYGMTILAVKIYHFVHDGLLIMFKIYHNRTMGTLVVFTVWHSLNIFYEAKVFLTLNRTLVPHFIYSFFRNRWLIYSFFRDICVTYSEKDFEKKLGYELFGEKIVGHAITI